MSPPVTVSDRPRRRGGLYQRVSNDPRGESVSPAQQEQENRAWCAANDIEVAWSITDPGYSASRYAKRERPGYAEVSRNLAGAAPVDVLVAWEASRYQRDLEVHVELRRLCTDAGRNVLLAYKGRVYDFTRPDDRFATGLDALLAERESEETRARVMRSIRARVAEGKPHGRLPYGYRSVHDTMTGAVVGRVPDPDTGQVAAEIVRRVAAGEPGYAIAKDLNARGVPSPHKARADRLGQVVDRPYPWTLEQVHRIARNPVYAGLRVHNGQVVGTGTWEPVVPLELHGQAVAALAGNATAARDSSARHLLSGIARCGVCGAVCRVIKNRGYLTYACWGMPGKRGTCCVARRQPYVDDRVTEVLLARMEQPDMVASLAEAAGDDEAAEAARELAELEERLGGFTDAAAAGQVSPAALARIEGQLLPRIEEARRRAVPTTVPAEVLALAGRGACQRWEGLTMPERRRVVRALVEVVIHKAPTRGARVFDPGLIEVRWR